MSDLARSLLLATRPLSFATSAIPVVAGTVWGVHAAGGHWRPGLFLLTLACALCLHAGANVLNDVGDDLNGTDRLNLDGIRPFTGGTRLIQTGQLSVRSMAVWGAMLILAGMALGAMLVKTAGIVALAFFLTGLALALAYSLPPLILAARGLGEGAAAVAFALPVVFAAWLQCGRFSLEPLLAAGVVGCWTAALVICNEMPDIRPDAAAGKRTLVVRLGIKQAPSLYLTIQAAASALLVALGWLANLPTWAMLPPVLTMLAALAAAPMMMRDRDSQRHAIHLTLGIDLLGGLALILAGLSARTPGL